MAMTEFETAMLALREREVAAHESMARANLDLAAETDVDVWRKYVLTARMSSPLVTATDARNWANSMLEMDKNRWPRT
jgi:hypothetical protein